MFWILLVSVAYGEDLKAQVEQAEQVMEETYAIQDDFHVLKVFLRDQQLLEEGLAPTGWVQPAFEVYEAELGARPSMLPYENFMQAVSKELVPSEEGVAYAVWIAEQERIAQEAAERAVAAEKGAAKR